MPPPSPHPLPRCLLTSHARLAPHLLAFGVAGGDIGLWVLLPIKRALKRLKVVLAEGIRAKVLAGPTAAALGVKAQPTAVLVTWRVSPGREKAFRGPSTHPPGPSWGADLLQGRERTRLPGLRVA